MTNTNGIESLVQNDHILELPNFIPKEICQSIIETYYNHTDLNKRNNLFKNGGMKEIQTDDNGYSFKFDNEYNFDNEFEQFVSHNILKCYEEYYEYNYYSLVCVNDKFVQINYQATDSYQGYHIWHADQTNTRLVTFIAYLNDVKEGGETEFLYQKKRITPETGKIIFFPASYTHTHRGNPVLSGETKHIITGWIYQVLEEKNDE